MWTCLGIDSWSVISGSCVVSERTLNWLRKVCLLDVHKSYISTLNQIYFESWYPPNDWQQLRDREKESVFVCMYKCVSCCRSSLELVALRWCFCLDGVKPSWRTLTAACSGPRKVASGSSWPFLTTSPLPTNLLWSQENLSIGRLLTLKSVSWGRSPMIQM